MTQNEDHRERYFKPALILFVICLVVTALLAGTNLLTKDKIAEQSALEAEQSRKVVLSDADSFEEADRYYIGKANNETVGYVFQTEAKGYGGAVKVMTGISADGQITRRCHSGTQRNTGSWRERGKGFLYGSV